jgi:TolB-like protein/tetratricopeptide (TPR) repeat protein
MPRLNSWKEIAAYFDRDIRTVQLWEKREALPIHRHEHSTRSSVYAFPDELDLWLRTRQHDRPSPRPEPIALPLPAPSPSRNPIRNPSRSSSRSLAAIILAAGILITFSVWAWRLHLRQQPSTLPLGPGQTLAVLPFDDLSADPSSNLWVYGFTDDLITDLGTTEHLQVISRRSVMPFQSTHDALPVIARKLNATLLLEGTVAHQNGTARITAQLFDPIHDRQIWAGSYTRHTDDILSLQDEIAADITSAVTEKLTGSPPQPSATATAVDPQVRLAYLTGLYYLNRRDEPGLLKAIDSFHQAIARDSHYALAYAGLADCYNLLAVWGKLPSSEAFPQARAAAQTALSLDPSSAQAYTSLAFETYRFEWNFSQAEIYFRKAIQLNPNYATAHQWFGEFLGDLRRVDESITELRKATDLDPLSAMVGSDLALGYMHAGRDAEAIAELHRILTVYPDFVPAHSYLTACYDDLGDGSNATREATIYTHLSGDDTVLQTLRINDDARNGKLPQARAELRNLLKHTDTTSFQQAQMYFAVNQPDQAYAELDRAYAEHSWWLVTLMVDPGFKSVRSQPRLHHLLQRIGLPVPPNLLASVSQPAS